MYEETPFRHSDLLDVLKKTFDELEGVCPEGCLKIPFGLERRLDDECGEIDVSVR